MSLFSPNIEKLKAQEDINGLVKALQQKDKAYDTSRSAAVALAELGVDGVEALLATIRDLEAREYSGMGEGERNALLAAGAGLGAARGPAAERLEAVATDESENFAVRLDAISALGDIGGPRATETLVRLLREGNAQETAARALGAVGGPAAIEALTAALHDQSASVVAAAGEVLTKLGVDIAVTDRAGLDEAQRSTAAAELVRDWKNTARLEDKGACALCGAHLDGGWILEVFAPSAQQPFRVSNAELRRLRSIDVLDAPLPAGLGYQLLCGPCATDLARQAVDVKAGHR